MKIYCMQYYLKYFRACIKYENVFTEIDNIKQKVNLQHFDYTIVHKYQC